MIWRRIFLQLKCLRFFSLVPPMVLFAVTSLIFVPMIQLSGATEEVYGLLLNYFQTITPIFSVWWTIFISREYVENNGNELLYMFKPRTLLREYLILFALYMFLALIVFFVLSFVFPSFMLEYIRIFCICLMFFGITYTVLYITSSVTLSFMIVLVFSIVNMTMYGESPNAVLYHSTQPFKPSVIGTVCIPQFIIGVIFIIVGYIANKRYIKYR